MVAAGASAAVADSLVLGDSLETSGAISLGPITCGQAQLVPLSAWINRSGTVNQNTFANSAAVEFTVSSSDEANVTPSTAQSIITLPDNWVGTGSPSDTNNTQSATAKLEVKVLPSSDDAGSATLTITATGNSAAYPKFETTQFAKSVTVSWPKRTCETGPQDEPPQVSLSAGSGAEGSAIALTGGITDDGLSPVSHTWSVVPGEDVDPGASCHISDETALDPTITCTDDGTYHVTLTASDAVGTDAKTADLVVTNAAPQITSASFGDGLLACGSENAKLNFEFTDPGSNDTQTASIDWGDGSTAMGVSSPASHTYNSGDYTATLTVTDDDGGFDTRTSRASVAFDMSGLLNPIKADGSSVFKSGSTVPVKIRVLDCSGMPVATLKPQLEVSLMSSGSPVGVAEVFSTSAADSGSTLRYTEDGQYIYNLATKKLPDQSGRYSLKVTLPNGQSATAQFGLK